jgi:hypothetical protein
MLSGCASRLEAGSGSVSNAKNKRNSRDEQVRHRLSGAAMLDRRGGAAPEVAAVDAAPRAGDMPQVHVLLRGHVEAFEATVGYASDNEPEDAE